MAKKQPKTVKPSGLTIKRSGDTFTASWKIADKDYGDGQAAQYKIGSNAWTNISVGATAKSKSFTVASSGWNPATSKALDYVSFRVRGNRKKYTQTTGKGKKRKTTTYNPTVSDWTTESMTFAVPDKPKITKEHESGTVTTFSWEVTNAGSDNKTYFKNLEYTSVLIQDCEETNGDKIDWNSTTWGQRYTSGNRGATGSLEVREDTGTINDGHSYTRWFRARSRGCKGNSGWVYSYQIYALPNRARPTNVECENEYVKVDYEVARSISRPIDTVSVEYGTAVYPPNSPTSWTEADKNVIKDGDTTGGAIFQLPQVDWDYTLFVRVNTTYDGRTTEGNEVFAFRAQLSMPSNLSVDRTNNTVTATNNSQVPDSYLSVLALTADNPGGYEIAQIPHGETSVYCTIPEGCLIGVRAQKEAPHMDTLYSRMIQETGDIPVAPDTVSALQANTSGTIRVTWDWTWADATSAELSWSNREDAWESTDDPETYTVQRRTVDGSSSWNIANLEVGTWYIRVRLAKGSGDNKSYSPYSEMVAVSLSSAPAIPSLTLSKATITEDEDFAASWTYSTTDGTSQAFAEIAEVTYEGGEIVYTKIAETQTEQQITLSPKDLEWETETSHDLACRVTSASGRQSDDWSNFVTITVAPPISCEITDTSLVTKVIPSTDEEGEPTTRTALCLDEMPLTLTVEGAGTDGQTTVVIERRGSYHVDRPDESDFNGYEGQTVYIHRQTGEAPITINNWDLIGCFDDEATYTIIATVSDGYGQSAEAEPIHFEVSWNHQAAIPNATVAIDEEEGIAILTPIAPEGAESGDVCDIYRLSIDKPELIYKGAEFGASYVDPYPTIGDNGGHRFVLRTANGDYITPENQFAWIDTRAADDDIFETPVNIIEWDGGRVELEYDIEVDHDWSKGFKETQYLGGQVTGDWTKAVSRSGNVSGNLLTIRDTETIQAMRRLATHAGICHVRTKDGSSIPANVDVQEKYSQSTAHNIANFTLKITRIDPQDLEGMTLEEWQETHPAEEKL